LSGAATSGDRSPTKAIFGFFLFFSSLAMASVRGMKLEDYPPYKALALQSFIGSEPFKPSECMCGRLGEGNGFCMCASSCMSDPRFSFYKSNPELYSAKQKELRQLFTIWKLWLEQKTLIEEKNWKNSKFVIYEFERRQDAESPIGCLSCEQWGQTYCTCSCENCSSKYCNGMCEDSD
jgi:hypothetical protein